MGKTYCAEPDADDKKPMKKSMKGKNPFGSKSFGGKK